MQLDPEIPFSTQVNNLSGNDFEKIVAASLYYPAVPDLQSGTGILGFVIRQLHPE